jgi:hypothetical protein
MQADDRDQVHGVCGETVKVGTKVNQRMQTSGKAGGFTLNGWQVEQEKGRKGRRGFGTGTVHKEAEGMRKEGMGMGNDGPRTKQIDGGRGGMMNSRGMGTMVQIGDGNGTVCR